MKEGRDGGREGKLKEERKERREGSKEEKGERGKPFPQPNLDLSPASRRGT